jgi:hypothetical protein
MRNEFADIELAIENCPVCKDLPEYCETCKDEIDALVDMCDNECDHDGAFSA